MGNVKEGNTRRGISRRIWVYGVLILVLGWALPRMTRSMIYPVPRQKVPDNPGKGLRHVKLVTPSKTRVSLWVKALPQDANAPLLLYFHGNAENLATLAASGQFEDLSRFGTHVIALDFPGYGQSTGKPNEEALVASGLLALEFAKTEFPQSPVILCGWSLGAAVAVQTAAQGKDWDGLILLSPWSNLKEVAQTHFPNWLVALLLHETYDSMAAAAKIDQPALIVHGEKDEVIPFHLGKKLSQAFRNAEFVAVPGSGHGDIFYWNQVRSSMKSYIQARNPQALKDSPIPQ